MAATNEYSRDQRNHHKTAQGTAKANTSKKNPTGKKSFQERYRDTMPAALTEMKGSL